MSRRTDRSITSEGFQFLLKDNYRQLWAFLTEYIRDAEGRSSEGEGHLSVHIPPLGVALSKPKPSSIISPPQTADDELSSVLSFLMQLGFRRVGQPCAWSELQNDSERAIAAHMMQLGLLRPFKADENSHHADSWDHKKHLKLEPQQLFFCPTRLASSLCDGFTHSAMYANADIAGGHIIVETNYRVYAFTTSKVRPSYYLQ